MEETRTPPEPDAWIGFSLKTIVMILVGIVLFIWYVRALLFGENSLSVLNRLNREEADLMQQAQTLKQTNQRLQKNYFELIQLNNVDE
jgi:cell division protein FtsB